MVLYFYITFGPLSATGPVWPRLPGGPGRPIGPLAPFCPDSPLKPLIVERITQLKNKSKLLYLLLGHHGQERLNLPHLLYCPI